MERVFGLPAGPLALWPRRRSLAVARRRRHRARRPQPRVPQDRAAQHPPPAGRSALIVARPDARHDHHRLGAADRRHHGGRAVRPSSSSPSGSPTRRSPAGTDADVVGHVGLDAAEALLRRQRGGRAPSTLATRRLPVDGVMAAIIEPVAAQHAAAGPDRAAGHAVRAGRRRVPADSGFGDVGDLADRRGPAQRGRGRELQAGAGDDITVLLVGDHLLDVAGGRRSATTGARPPTDRRAILTARAGPGAARPTRARSTTSWCRTPASDTGGAGHTDAVEAAARRGRRRRSGLDAQPAKQDGLDAADATGNAFVQLFTTFGSFSMAAGILLIFLIFVMLAAERRPEMGMARAVGTQRRHLVQTFLFEGAAYDVAAAAVGALLGIGVSYVMVRAVASAFTDRGPRRSPTRCPVRSLADRLRHRRAAHARRRDRVGVAGAAGSTSSAPSATSPRPAATGTGRRAGR